MTVLRFILFLVLLVAALAFQFWLLASPENRQRKWMMVVSLAVFFGLYEFARWCL